METSYQAVITAAKLLISSEDGNGIVNILLQYAMKISRAFGASFVPLDDRGFPVAAKRQGEFPVFISDAWLEYLASPPVRQNCSQCMNYGQFVETCQLIQGPYSNTTGIYCLPVRYVDHDLGILNLYMPASGIQEKNTLELLNLLIDASALAIANDRLRRRELSMFRQFQSMRQTLDLNQSNESLKNESLIEEKIRQIEYKILMEERTRLAREIHDGLAQTLGFLKLQAFQLKSSLERGNTAQSQQISHSLYEALSDAYLDAREAINLLRIVPGEPSKARLGNWLRRTVEEFQENTQIQVSLQELAAQPHFPEEVHLQVIRIIQEALVNVRKHAKAHHIHISSYESDQLFIMEVQDDGVGFCVNDVPSPSQHGLEGMRERAALIGAELQFFSQPNQGTTVRLALPIQSRWGENNP